MTLKHSFYVDLSPVLAPLCHATLRSRQWSLGVSVALRDREGPELDYGDLWSHHKILTNHNRVGSVLCQDLFQGCVA